MPPPHDDDRPHPLLRLLIALAAVALCLAGLRRLAERRMAERFHYMQPADCLGSGERAQGPGTAGHILELFHT